MSLPNYPLPSPKSAPNLIVISPYPHMEVYSHTLSALAAFAHHTVTTLLKYYPYLSILILADYLDHPPASPAIKYVWHRNSFRGYFTLFKTLLNYSASTPILIQHEWNLFGSRFLVNAFFPIFTLILKLFRRQLFVVLHGVPDNIKDFVPNLGLPNHFLFLLLLRLGLWGYYLILLFSSTKTIVLENHFSSYLNSHFLGSKAFFIPHPVDNHLHAINKTEARHQLGLPQNKFILMHFGFLNWYKGSDLIVNLFTQLLQQNPHLNSQLLLAGGPTNHYQDKHFYQDFLSDINSAVSQFPHSIRLTGFIPHSQISAYYSAADVIVFPYRQFLSSSGPLSLAFSFHKPILLSANLTPYLESPDFHQALNHACLTPSDLFFDLTPASLLTKINQFQTTDISSTLSQFSSIMAQKRSWNHLIHQYYRLIFSHE